MASVIQTISKRPSISIVEDWIYTRLPTEFPKEPKDIIAFLSSKVTVITQIVDAFPLETGNRTLPDR